MNCNSAVAETAASETSSLDPKATAVPSDTKEGLPLAKPTDPDTNIAKGAKSSASSYLGESPPKLINDGVFGYEEPKNGWIAKGTSPEWVQLDWPEQYLMQSIVLYGLGDENDLITSGTLSLSDGTVVKIDGPISPKGSWVHLGEGIYSSSLRFTTAGTSETTKNLGLSEIQICKALSLSAP